MKDMTCIGTDIVNDADRNTATIVVILLALAHTDVPYLYRR